LIGAAFDRLAQDHLDGVATAGEVAELERLLESSHEARTRYQEMRTVFETLGRQPLLEPPPALRAGILKAVARIPSPASRQGWLAGVAVALRQPVLRTASAFALGVALGVLTIGVAGRNPSRGAQDAAIGTMAPLSDRGRLVDRRQLRAAGVAATAETWRRFNRVTAAVALTAPGEMELLMVFDPALLRVTAVRPSPAADGRMEMGPGRIVVRQGGEARYEVDLEIQNAAAPAIAVTIRAADQIAETVLATGVSSHRP
jgi:hypothetical protein